jgi:hypothetical protein
MIFSSAEYHLPLVISFPISDPPLYKSHARGVSEQDIQVRGFGSCTIRNNQMRLRGSVASLRSKDKYITSRADNIQRCALVTSEEMYAQSWNRTKICYLQDSRTSRCTNRAL